MRSAANVLKTRGEWQGRETVGKQELHEARAAFIAVGMDGTVARYSTGAIVLHWLIALLLAGEIALGFTMPRDARGFELFQLHKSIGITILLLSLIRLGWRLTHPRPAPIEGGVTGFLASAVHVLFYAFMILMPLTGWAIVSSSDLDVPTLLFGAVPWPHLPLSESTNGFFAESHELLAFGGLGLFVLHVAGAIRHHFLLGDGLLARMAPRGRTGIAVALAATVMALGLGVFAAVGPRSEEHDHATDHARGEEHEPADGAQDAAQSDGEAEDHDHSAHNHEGEAIEEDPAADSSPAATPSASPTPEQEEAGPPPSWAIQPGGSLRFGVSNGDMRMNGNFGRWSGTIAMDPADPSDAAIAITVQLASATLGNATQDEMLRGGDFLAAGSSGTATWRSNSVTRTGANTYRANGTLSLKGASRAQPITFTLGGSGNRRSVSGQAVVDRNAFGIGTGENAAGLGGQVTVDFAFDAVR